VLVRDVVARFVRDARLAGIDSRRLPCPQRPVCTCTDASSARHFSTDRTTGSLWFGPVRVPAAHHAPPVRQTAQTLMQLVSLRIPSRLLCDRRVGLGQRVHVPKCRRSTGMPSRLNLSRLISKGPMRILLLSPWFGSSLLPGAQVEKSGGYRHHSTASRSPIVPLA